MFIYRFHRIIRHRIVWGLFAGIVSILFMFTGYSYMNGRNVVAVAHIDGQPVSEETFSSLEIGVRGIGRNRKDGIPFPIVATQVWQQAAALQVAEKLKFDASREEIKTAVQESLGVTEGYDSNIHQNYLMNLNHLKLNPAQYEQHLAHAIMLRKLGSILDAAAWTTPIEVDDELGGLTDEMTVRAIAVSNRFASLAATEAQVQAFFDAHTNAFYLPRRIAVQYVVVSVSNYLDRVSLSDDMIKEYFDDNSDKLTLTNTDEKLRRAEASPQIIAILKYQAAGHAAHTNLANAFLEIATKGGSNGFAAAASAFGLSIHETPFFALKEPLPGIDAAKEFREAAFDLDPSQTEGRYGVVQGSNFVYAITQAANSPAHMPRLEEVVDRVRPLAVAKIRDDRFHDELIALHKELVAALHEAKNLSAVAQARALNVSTAITFSVQTLQQNAFENYYAVARAAIHLQSGELSEAAMTGEEDASALFVYMVARKPGDPLSADMLRPRARANIERALNMGLSSSWMEWNLARKGLSLNQQLGSRLATRTDNANPSDE